MEILERYEKIIGYLDGYVRTVLLCKEINLSDFLSTFYIVNSRSFRKQMINLNLICIDSEFNAIESRETSTVYYLVNVRNLVCAWKEWTLCMYTIDKGFLNCFDVPLCFLCTNSCIQFIWTIQFNSIQIVYTHAWPDQSLTTFYVRQSVGVYSFELEIASKLSF